MKLQRRTLYKRFLKNNNNKSDKVEQQFTKAKVNFKSTNGYKLDKI